MQIAESESRFGCRKTLSSFVVTVDVGIVVSRKVTKEV